MAGFLEPIWSPAQVDWQRNSDVPPGNTVTAESHTYIRRYFIDRLVFPSLGQKPNHISQPAVRGLVHPQRVLQVTAIHPVAEVLALAVTPPGLPEDGGWGRGETKSAAAFSPCSEKNRKEAWALNHSKERG